LLLVAVIDSLGVPSLPRTPQVHKKLHKFDGRQRRFRAFSRRAWHYQGVGKKPDAAKPEQAPPTGDVALVFGKNEQGVHILRRRDENAPIEAGLLQPLVEGRPITGELISMKQREDMPLLYDVKSEMGASETHAAREVRDVRSSGPSQVATDEYRKGWDAIWGGRGSSRRDVN
jgi:hypothetical protein